MASRTRTAQARVVKPERLGECRTTNAQSDTPAAAAREPWCAGPSDARTRPERRGRATDARCTRWLAPDACDESRNRSHNSKMLRHARTGPERPTTTPRTGAVPRDESDAHGRRSCRDTGPRAAAHPEPLLVPKEHHTTRRRPAASQWGEKVTPPSRKPLSSCLALPASLVRFPGNFPAKHKTRQRACCHQNILQPGNHPATPTRQHETKPAQHRFSQPAAAVERPPPLHGAPWRWCGRPACPPAARRPPPASHRRRHRPHAGDGQQPELAPAASSHAVPASSSHIIFAHRHRPNEDIRPFEDIAQMRTFARLRTSPK